MTTAFDNEVDRLLRRHTPDADGSHDSAHLDADTLALYAEQALPARTRAAHTEHLATCDDCRASLAMLSRLLTPEHETAVAAETSPQPSPMLQDAAPRRGLRSLLRELFAAPRLAYALPAVLLLVVGSVLLLLFMRRNEPETIALVAERASSTSGAVMNSNMNANMASANMNGNTGVPSATAATVNNASAASSAQASSTTATDAATPDIVPSAADAPVDLAAPAVTRPASARAQTDAAARSGTIVVSPVSTPPGAPESASAASPTSTSAKPEPQSMPATTEDEAIEVKRNRPPAPIVASRRVAPASSDERARTPLARRDDEVAVENRATRSAEKIESRKIADRRFARRGATWVDEAYVPGATVIAIARDSEQLRALLADEPGLRRIVEALPGEMIVVWKNRAYRIR